jgi:hypothetical protein
MQPAVTQTSRSAQEQPARATTRWIKSGVVPGRYGSSRRRVTESTWVACAISLLTHTILLLILAAWILSHSRAESGLSIDSRLGADADETDSLDSVVFETPQAQSAESSHELATVEVPVTAAGLSDAANDSAPLELAGFASIPGEDKGQAGGRRGAGSIGFFGERASGSSFVFIVDSSGSMEGSRFARAVEELNRAIGQLRIKQQFYVIFYNDEAVPLFSPNSRNRMYRASGKNRRRAKKWIGLQQAGGGTEPEAAIHQALRLKPDVIFFLSDGEVPRTTRTVATEFNHFGTIINTIAFQFRGGEAILKGIAEDNQGNYRFVE